MGSEIILLSMANGALSITNQPHLFDLQVNGATVFDKLQRPKVVDFSSPDLTARDVERVSGLLATKGVRSYLATIVTSPSEVVLKNVRTIAEVMKENPDLRGIHLEGPFFSKSCKGAHQPEFIIERGEPGLFEKFQDAAGGAVVLVTVSPAIEKAPEFIEFISKSGVIVSLGHHDANTSQIREAVSAGATGVTHAGNGWSKEAGTHPRQIADVLAQLSAKGMYVMLIPDGEHVKKDFIEEVHNIVELLRPGHTIFVSDCSPLAGAPAGEYEVYHGTKVTIQRQPNGELRGKPLSGSYLLLSECLDALREINIIEESAIQRGASQAPFEFMRRALERIGRFPSLDPL